MNNEPQPRANRISVGRFVAVLCLSVIGTVGFFAAEQDTIEFSKETPYISAPDLMRDIEEIGAEVLVAAVALGSAVRIATNPDQ